MKEREKGRG